MKIERLTARKGRHGNIQHEQKLVCTKIDEHHYLAQGYARQPQESDKWVDLATTTNFDGQNKVNGVLRTCTVDTVDEKFELLIKYEGYKLVD